jgi:hypothetical protein
MGSLGQYHVLPFIHTVLAPAQGVQNITGMHVHLDIVLIDSVSPGPHSTRGHCACAKGLVKILIRSV